MLLDPFYLALGLFALFIFVTLFVSACIRKCRNRRRTGNRRPFPFMNTSTTEDTEARAYDGPINLYEAKAHFEYDPDLLPLSGNKSSEEARPNGLSYLTRLPDDNISIALEQNFYEMYTKK